MKLNFRFNPHNSKEIKFELVDRLNVLVETVYQLLEEEDLIVYEDTIGCRIVYMFYPAENAHKKWPNLLSQLLKFFRMF